MFETAISARGLVSAPHRLAAEAGLRVLQDGGNAIEAMVAAAAAITVVYPHMNALGGDNFWLIHDGETTHAIDACGAAASAASPEGYRERGHDAIPTRGPLAALTAAGAVSGWRAALDVSEALGGRLPLDRLLEDAIWHARNGFPVTRNLHANVRDKLDELIEAPGFAAQFTDGGRPPVPGAVMTMPKVAATFERLAAAGLDDFYRGDIARSIAKDLSALGSPVALSDLERHRAKLVAALTTEAYGARVLNLPPPTQGLASLIILGVLDRLPTASPESADFVHAIVEATKLAFRVRDRHVVDPEHMEVSPGSFLEPAALDAMARDVDMTKAAPWPHPAAHGDTVWLGAADAEGRVVSFIQSVYWEFGSGVVLPETGIVWQNRGASFSLDVDALNVLAPGKRPFHTIQPCMAFFKDGRAMAYGTMGGEGQPQTQAAVFSRYAAHETPLQEAVTAPRWLLGRTWGAETTNLRIENRFGPDVIEALIDRGHDIEVTGPFDEVMGHAGAVVRRPDGFIEGASDPRSDGAVALF